MQPRGCARAIPPVLNQVTGVGCVADAMVAGDDVVVVAGDVAVVAQPIITNTPTETPNTEPLALSMSSPPVIPTPTTRSSRRRLCPEEHCSATPPRRFVASICICFPERNLTEGQPLHGSKRHVF